jgi:UDP-N-acetylglucosamine--N-acetylmuramyl-(pentapeptide) pyrophosphoryl-undecaprenol N-acetylglucosamine transferase
MKPIRFLSSSVPHIVFAGGGTGGHLFPGLAVAEQLLHQLPQARITLVGSGKPFERRQVAAAGLEYLALRCRPVPRRVGEAFSFFVENLAGYLAARRFLAEARPDAVVGLGGYASVPLGKAALRCGVPLVLLEQNAVPGRATRWLSRRADMICLAMAPARHALRCRCPVYVTGNPLRAAFQTCFPHANHPPAVDISAPQTGAAACSATPRQLLIFGGSSGARSLNENVPRALCRLGPRIAGWRIVHQAGESDVEATRQLYRKLALEATVVDFIADIPEVLAASTLAICRCGGTTLAELAVAGVPAVLVPYPHASDDHQRRNAEVLAAADAAVIVDERSLPGGLDGQLAVAISPLLDSPDRRGQMSLAIRRLARPDAAAWVATLIRWYAVERPRRLALPAAA